MSKNTKGKKHKSYTNRDPKGHFIKNTNGSDKKDANCYKDHNANNIRNEIQTNLDDKEMSDKEISDAAVVYMSGILKFVELLDSAITEVDNDMRQRAEIRKNKMIRRMRFWKTVFRVGGYGLAFVAGAYAMRCVGLYYGL